MKPHHQVSKTNGRQPKEIITKHDPIVCGKKNSEDLERKLDTGDLSNVILNSRVHNSLLEGTKKVERDKNRVRGNRADKSTSEQVMDPKTRLILLKMLNSDIIGELHGVINTGKEANVYHALSGLPSNRDEDNPEADQSREYAIKIFKTTLNEFKNRSEYIEGEFRFRHRGVNNSRKLIRLWAEKEMRNLKRLRDADIPCPKPILLREHILVMSFLGKNGWPSPLLKDAQLSSEKFNECYDQCIKLMRKMYQSCKLVHGDLSEYNMMYHKNKLWVIDVSQAVENDHPKALEFLRRDCNCISTFFGKYMENVLSAKQLFNFVTDISIQEENVDKYLEKMNELIDQQSGKEKTNEEQIAEGVFQKSFIPRTLHQVSSPVQEIFENKTGLHEAVTGIRSDIQEV